MKTNCDYCMNYSYDEDYDEYMCDVSLDEDEMAHFLMREFKECPYYKPGNEYSIVKKQM